MNFGTKLVDDNQLVSDGGWKRPYSYKIIDFPYENPNKGTGPDWQITLYWTKGANKG